MSSPDCWSQQRQFSSSRRFQLYGADAQVALPQAAGLQNQAEADGVSLRGFRNAQFRLFRVLHELQGDQLQVLADLFYGRMHEGNMGYFHESYYKAA